MGNEYGLRQLGSFQGLGVSSFFPLVTYRFGIKFCPRGYDLLLYSGNYRTENLALRLLDPK